MTFAFFCFVLIFNEDFGNQSPNEKKKKNKKKKKSVLVQFVYPTKDYL